MVAGPCAERPDGVSLAIRLTPRAGREGLDGLVATPDGGLAVQIRLAAPPVEGAANAALLGFLARSLGLRRSDVTLLAGARSRLKRVHLAGPPAALAARIDAWLAPHST